MQSRNNPSSSNKLAYPDRQEHVQTESLLSSGASPRKAICLLHHPECSKHTRHLRKTALNASNASMHTN
eukprot:3736128-Pleurochrysis_carterae.AAC.1